MVGTKTQTSCPGAPGKKTGRIAVAGHLPQHTQFTSLFETEIKGCIGISYDKYPGGLNVRTGVYSAFERLVIRLCGELKTKYPRLTLSVFLTQREYTAYLRFLETGADDKKRWTYIHYADDVVCMPGDFFYTAYNKRNAQITDNIDGLIHMCTRFKPHDQITENLLYRAREQNTYIFNVWIR